MRKSRLLLALSLVAVSLTAAGAPASGHVPNNGPLAVGRQALPPNDGWGSATTGTTGGAQADAAHTFRVHDREELVAALGDGTDPAPRLVFVTGKVDGDDAPDGCARYADPAYSLDAYLAAYDPAGWGRTAKPSGPLETARAASQANQGAETKIRVYGNTTIFGMGGGARLSGMNLVLSGVDNVIIRNLTIEAPVDCFPSWDPTDGATGNWNSEYDAITLTYGSTHVWIDHNTFGDGRYPDTSQPLYFGRPYQWHDGLVDLIRGSDLVTMSWNVFADHDKTHLIGNTDKTTNGDEGKLHVTIHHNVYHNVGQRVPRVRFGQADVFNNLYQVTDASAYSYSWGVGVSSAIVAQHNAFELPEGVNPAQVIKYWKGTAITASDNVVNGQVVDLLSAYNAVNVEQLGADAGWTPTLRTAVHAPTQLARVLGDLAGAGRADREEQITVDPTGLGDVTTVQAAVDAAPAGSQARVVIRVRPGLYRETVTVPAEKPNLAIVGTSGRPEDVVIVENHCNGCLKPDGTTYGTTGSATVTLKGDDFTARDVTFANDFDEAAHPAISSKQAVAVKTTGDRIAFSNVRFLGNQDTLYVDTPGAAYTSRVYIRDSYVEGDVDFIFGRATAVFDRVHIHGLDRGLNPAGYFTAASTQLVNPHGYLIIHSRLTSDAPEQTYYLGRPWHPSNDPNAQAQVVIRESSLPAAVKGTPWTDMSGFSWRDARFAEYRNYGPGALPPGGDGTDRPQLTDSQAEAYTVATYLADWSPLR
ncbi:pectinesterase family protein [Catellatospora tritici]|uniref:pectinesterase family protein n=1 Tax=Catellatospora tritici TaxID=2851566 RepID=UPI001C2CD07E|nr:pectinesterase family protein [Catellatospora tritici]MBV1852598.1 hypothetical protein [Catellatospora tritici]